MTATDGVAVRVSGLTKRFGAKVAVEQVSLTIERGAVFGLIGPNGAGKTTTFSMLAGFLRPSSGEVAVLGEPPDAVDALRGRLGVLPQDAILPANERVGDFLVHMARLQDLPARKAIDCARQALDEVSGRDFWDQRCGRLSHGMAKRVALAQAFLGEPELVLLDEPTAGLDPRVAWEVRQALLAKRGRCTIVVSSHNLKELEEVCDGAAILDRGRIVAGGSMRELTAENEEIRVRVPVGTTGGGAPGQVPLAVLRRLERVESATFDEARLEIVVGFDRRKAQAEDVIGDVLRVLLDGGVRISGVTKGRGLEQRVIQMT